MHCFPFPLSPLPPPTSHFLFGVLLAITLSQIKPLRSWWKRPEPVQQSSPLSHPFSTVSSHQSAGHAPLRSVNPQIYKCIQRALQGKQFKRHDPLPRRLYSKSHRNKHQERVNHFVKLEQQKRRSVWETLTEGRKF